MYLSYSGSTNEPIRKEINAIYAALNKLNLIFLKQKNVGKFTPEVTFSVDSIESV
jgi:hypothetical protein